MKHENIIQFIELHFRNKKERLIPMIDGFLKNSTFSQDFDALFEAHVPAPRQYDCYNSEKKKRKVSELGDISDIWTFILTKDIKISYPNFTEKGFWCEEDFLGKGGEIHFCQVWINWFLKFYYIEPYYRVNDIANNTEQGGNLVIEDADEQHIFDSIIASLQSVGYTGLEKECLMQTMKGITTDCSVKNNATIFDCLFSDILYPMKHTRIFKEPITISGITFSIKEYLDTNRNVIEKEMKIWQDKLFTPVVITFNAQNKVDKVMHYGLIDGKKATQKMVKHGYRI